MTFLALLMTATVFIAAPKAEALTVHCPSTESDWINFRDAAALKIVSKTGDDDADAGKTPAIEAARQTQTIFQTCYDETKAPFNGNKALIASFAHLKRFANGFKHQGLGNFQMGMNVPDTQYFKETSAFTEIPTDLKNPKLLALFSDPAHIGEGLKFLETLNGTYPADKKIIFFRYTSNISRRLTRAKSMAAC